MLPQQIVSAYDRFTSPASSGFTYCPKCAVPLLASTGPETPRQICPACGWIHYLNPTPGVVILIAEGDCVLLGKRGQSSFGAGLWCLPGGFIEYEEDFLSAAIRETREETGLTIEICSILSVVSNFLAHDLHTLVVVLKGRILAGTPAAGDDLTELKWVPLPGPFPPLAFEADRHIIERYQRTLLEGAPVDPRYARPSTGTPS